MRKAKPKPKPYAAMQKESNRLGSLETGMERLRQQREASYQWFLYDTRSRPMTLQETERMRK